MTTESHDSDTPQKADCPSAPFSASFDLHLYEDSRWKEEALTKLEIILDDSRNASCAGIGDLGDHMQYGKSYRVTLTIEEIDCDSFSLPNSQDQVRR